MAERRSIDDALALAPEKLAFIHGANTLPSTEPVETVNQTDTSPKVSETQPV